MGKWMMIPIAMAVMLSACSGKATSSSTRDEAQARAAQLALGTIGLEGTLEAVDAGQAAELVARWELLSELSVNSTAAAEELAATVTAIEAAMTPDQLAAIEAMDLSGMEVARAIPVGGPPADEGGADEGAPLEQGEMDPSMGGDMAGGMGGMPMDGGMPGSGPLQVAAGGPTTASTGAYADVIALLQSKIRT